MAGARLARVQADRDALLTLEAHYLGLQEAHNSLCQASDKEVQELKARVKALEDIIATNTSWTAPGLPTNPPPLIHAPDLLLTGDQLFRLDQQPQ